MRTELLFVGFPYAAAAILAVGLVVRLVLARGHMSETRERAGRAWALFGTGRAWRAALLLLIGAHLVGLLLPRIILSWNSAPLRQYVLEGAGLGAGILALAGWARVMWRHLERRHGSIAGEVVDCVWLSLLFVAVASGIVVAVGYRWASSWAGATVAPYFETLLVGAPATTLVERLPFLVQLHVVSLFALVALFPLSGAAVLAIAAIDRVAAVAVRPLRAGVRFLRARTAAERVAGSAGAPKGSEAGELQVPGPVDGMGGVAASSESPATRA